MNINTLHTFARAIGAASMLAACGSAPNSQDMDRFAQGIIKSSFRDQGIAKVDRLNQDELQQACSGEKPPSEEVAKRIEAAQLATVQWPSDGNFVGDWREGEKLAQNGRGMTWSDPVGVPSGGNCYNCHQIAKAEISFGTIGPSLYQYGKIRGVADPADPASQAVVKYTWGKLWNAKAYNACSGMPRFGHAGVLTQAQIRDLMALLLDPKSPVNSR
jgi:sulfur-oxidizing protein SoxX